MKKQDLQDILIITIVGVIVWVITWGTQGILTSWDGQCKNEVIDNYLIERKHNWFFMGTCMTKNPRLDNKGWQFP